VDAPFILNADTLTVSPHTHTQITFYVLLATNSSIHFNLLNTIELISKDAEIISLYSVCEMMIQMNKQIIDLSFIEPNLIFWN